MYDTLQSTAQSYSTVNIRNVACNKRSYHFMKSDNILQWIVEVWSFKTDCFSKIPNREPYNSKFNNLHYQFQIQTLIKLLNVK